VKKDSRQRDRKKRGSPAIRVLKWAALLVPLAFTIWAIAQTAGVAYDEDEIKVVNFSALTASEKRSALRAANRARCTCGCGMGLAQCVSTDITCPVRERNVQSIRSMVREADKS
jgi:hypothetical protein